MAVVNDAAEHLTVSIDVHLAARLHLKPLPGKSRGNKNRGRLSDLELYTQFSNMIAPAPIFVKRYSELYWVPLTCRLRQHK